MENIYILISSSTSKYHYIISFVILVISGITNFLSCCFPLLTKRPIFKCSDVNGLTITCQAEQICDPSHTPNIYSCRKDPFLSISNYSYQFDFYCDRYYYIGILGTSFYFGAMLGSMIFGTAADKFGRKNTFRVLIVINLLLLFNLYFAYSPFHLIIIFFLSGLGNYSKSLCNILIAEFMQNSISGIVISISNTMFPIFGILIGLYYLFINSLQILLVILILLTTITVILSYIYIVESPRWLMSQKRIDEAIEALGFIAQVNHLEDKFNGYLLENAAKENQLNDLKIKKNIYFSYWDILSLKSQQKKLLIMSFLSFTSSFCYYGLILNIDNYKGDFFSDFFMTYIAESVALMMSGYLADYFSRLTVMKLFSLISSTAFILFDLMPGNEVFAPLFVFIISFGISAVYNVTSITMNETFPTIIRSSCIGFTNVIGKLATTFVPSVVVLIPHSSLLLAAFLLMGFLSMYALEETKGKEKDDIVPEMNEDETKYHLIAEEDTDKVK